MNYKEAGFRALYQRFAAFTLTEKTRRYLHAFPGGGHANCMLTWGYIDPEEGLMLEAPDEDAVENE